MSLVRAAEQALGLDPKVHADLLYYLRLKRPPPLWKWLELIEARDTFIEARSDGLTVEEAINKARLAVGRDPRTVERWRDETWGD